MSRNYESKNINIEENYSMHINKPDLFAYLLLMTASQAALASGNTPVSDGLQYITNAMYGATGMALATIAVMFVGLLCLAHMLKWQTLGYTIVGISLIFGAGSIVNNIVSLVR